MCLNRCRIEFSINAFENFTLRGILQFSKIYKKYLSCHLIIVCLYTCSYIFPSSQRSSPMSHQTFGDSFMELHLIVVPVQRPSFSNFPITYYHK